MSGQLHAPAALPSGKEPPVAIREEAVWVPQPFWTTWGKYSTAEIIKMVQ
jgi:hypothetical protein